MDEADWDEVELDYSQSYSSYTYATSVDEGWRPECTPAATSVAEDISVAVAEDTSVAVAEDTSVEEHSSTEEVTSVEEMQSQIELAAAVAALE